MELSELRAELDAIDAQMLTLFERRMELSAAVAKYKKDQGLPVRDAIREEAILARAMDTAGPDGRRLYEVILCLSREKQERLLQK